MAISFLGETTVDAGIATAITFNIPSGYPPGTTLIAFVRGSNNVNAGVWDDDGGNGNGWVREAYNRTTVGRDIESAVYWKRLDTVSDFEPSPTFTLGGNTQSISGTVLAYSDLDISSPFSLSYRGGVNAPDSPNATILVTEAAQPIVLLQAVTHDDISAPAPPAGYVMRAQVWAGVNNEHRNMFAADLMAGSGTVGDYTPPNWAHSKLNNTPEYHVYTLALNEPIASVIQSSNAGRYDNGDIASLTGYGFNGPNRKLYMSDSPVFGAGTLVQQVVETFSTDTTLLFTVNKGALLNGFVYLFVENDNNGVTAPYKVIVGNAYYLRALETGPDHFWRLDGAYTDNVRGFDATQSPAGSFDFGGDPLVRDSTSSWRVNANSARVEVPDSEYTNVTVQHSKREVCGWIKLDRVHRTPSGIWEEGGGVNNLYMVIGFGNRLLCNIADSQKNFKAQAFSDFRLSVNRPYHILLRFEGSDGIDGIECWIDGVKQTSPAIGVPIGETVHSQHGGDFSFGKPDGSLDTGGTDVAYPGATRTNWSHWATFSEHGGGAPLTPEQRRVELFEAGAIPTVTITSGSQAAMQSQLDALANSDYPDVPLAIMVEDVAGGGALALDASGITFGERTSCHVQWLGTGTLTWKNLNGSNASIFSTLEGGTVNVINPATLTLTALQENTEVRIFEAGTTTEIAGQESVTGGTFSASVEAAAVDISVLSLGFKNLRLKGVAVPGDLALPIQQLTDRQYRND